MNTQIKPLEWTVFCSRSGNSVAKTPFGEYVIQIEPDGWCLYLLNSDDPHASYSMSDFAKFAAQVDYETRILSALISSPGKDGGQEVEAVNWRDGAPPKPWCDEWFIAETTYGDRVVLTALPKDWAYDFKTADSTYIKADKIKRWMQFPDSQFIASQPASTALVERLRQLHAEQHRILGEMLLDKSEEGQARANWQGGKVNGIAAALSASTSREGESRG